jgi:hypothetical protein
VGVSVMRPTTSAMCEKSGSHTRSRQMSTAISSAFSYRLYIAPVVTLAPAAMSAAERSSRPRASAVLTIDERRRESVSLVLRRGLPRRPLRPDADGAGGGGGGGATQAGYRRWSLPVIRKTSLDLPACGDLPFGLE